MANRKILLVVWVMVTAVGISVSAHPRLINPKITSRVSTSLQEVRIFREEISNITNEVFSIENAERGSYNDGNLKPSLFPPPPLDICQDLPQSLKDEIRSYQSTANKIIEAAINGSFKGRTYNELSYFVDKFGSRIAGSDNLERAIDYMLEKLEQDELDNVHGEKVTVPHWVR